MAVTFLTNEDKVELEAKIQKVREEVQESNGNAGRLLTVESIVMGEEPGDETENIPVTGLSLDLTSYSAKVGGGFYINPVVIPSNATNKAVTWKSGETNIATVDGNGYVECIAEGSAVITCTTMDGGFTATCAVSVAAAESGETEVTLSGISATYSGGDVAVGTAVTDLTGITVTATYSDSSTATVTDYTLSGTIAEGSNTVTVSYGGKTTTFTVTGLAESSGDTTVYFKDSPYTLVEGSLMKPTGAMVAISNSGHLAIPYTEGITIYTCMNPGWSTSTYPHFIVLENGTYTPVVGEATGESPITGVSQYVATFTGYGDGAVIYANMARADYMQRDESDSSDIDTTTFYYYIIPGGEA